MPEDEVKKTAPQTQENVNPQVKPETKTPASPPQQTAAQKPQPAVKPAAGSVQPAQPKTVSQTAPVASAQTAAQIVPKTAVQSAATTPVQPAAAQATPKTPAPANTEKKVEPVKTATMPKKEEFTGAPVKTRTVMVIDNDKNLMHEITEFTKRKAIKEINFLFAENAKVCLEKMQQEKPDLVIIELLLPTVSGYYLLKIFEKENIPAIIYTILKSPEDLKKMSESKAGNIFLKTLTKSEELVQFIKTRTEYNENLKEVVDKLQKEMRAMEGKDDKGQVKVVQCPKCNTILAPQSHFCNNCGQKIVRERKQIPINAKNADSKSKK